jgi:hypothetical protein
MPRVINVLRKKKKEVSGPDCLTMANGSELCPVHWQLNRDRNARPCVSRPSAQLRSQRPEVKLGNCGRNYFIYFEHTSSRCLILGLIRSKVAAESLNNEASHREKPTRSLWRPYKMCAVRESDIVVRQEYGTWSIQVEFYSYRTVSASTLLLNTLLYKLSAEAGSYSTGFPPPVGP